MPLEPFKTGSADKIKGRIRDRIGVDLVPVDLTGATVLLKAKIGKVWAKSFTATADPDQVNNRGVWTYQLLTTDLDRAGDMELETHWVVAGVPHKSKSIFVTVEKAVA